MDSLLSTYLDASFLDDLFSVIGLVPAGMALAFIAWVLGWFVDWFITLLRRNA